MDNQEIIYKLDSSADCSTALRKVTNELQSKLMTTFGQQYTVTTSEFTTPEKDWSQEIKVRKGNKIGVAVTLRWEQSSPSIVKIDVDESIKMGSLILLGITIPFLLVGAYMGYNNIEPLQFLPGKKIAAGLGGLITVIPGLILALICKSIVLKNEKSTNAQLILDVKKVI